MNKATKENFLQSDEKEARKLLTLGTARKRSMLPFGNSANTSKNIYCKICMKTKICVCFRI
jgi:hypothetical protein